MARLPLLAVTLMSVLTVPTIAAAQPRPDPHHNNRGNDRNDRNDRNERERVERERIERERREHDTSRPGVAVRVEPPRWHSTREADERYRDLQARRAQLAEKDRRELSELEARQRRLDEMRRRDAERDRDRAERIRRAHAEQAARFRAPPSPAMQEEYRRYAQRKAALQRAKEIADAEGRVDVSARASNLLAAEEQRHAAWISVHAG